MLIIKIKEEINKIETKYIIYIITKNYLEKYI